MSRTEQPNPADRPHPADFFTPEERLAACLDIEARFEQARRAEPINLQPLAERVKECSLR